MGCGEKESLHNLKEVQMSKRNVLLALAALLIAAGSAYAQSIKFQVPFQFTIDNMVMPAGYYWIESSHDSGLLAIEGLDRQTSPKRFLNANPVESLGRQYEAKLIFNCYGGSCFLSQVWTGNNVGRQLGESRQERQLAKQGLEPRVPALAALRSVQ
jgi:hypothetical protein